MTPMEAALKGAGEIGFTIISISLSLIAVFIPLLLMGGIVGRLFREFGVTVAMTIAVSAVVSLTLTPMMCARFMRADREVRHGRLYTRLGTGFRYPARRLPPQSRCRPSPPLHHLRRLSRHLVATGYLFIVIPKGFFPQQDTGLIIGTSEAAQDISFAEMVRRQRALGEVVARGSRRRHGRHGGGAGGAQTQNNGRFFITLKPRDQRNVTADQVIRRLQPKLAKVEGAALFLQVVQDINIGGRLARTQYQYTLLDADLGELDTWAPKILAELKNLPELARRRQRPADGRCHLTLTIDRDQAARFGIQPALIDNTLYDAFGQRQVTQYFTQLNSYHVVMEVLPELQSHPNTLNNLYVNSPITGQQVPLRHLGQMDDTPTTFLSINHQSQFPAVTLSFNLAPGVALGQAVAAVKLPRPRWARRPR